VAPLPRQHFTADSGISRSNLLPLHHSDFRKFRAGFRDLRHSANVSDTYPPDVPTEIVMNNDKKDVVTLIELLKMADERRAHLSQISLHEPFNEDFSLLQMWAEACHRTGGAARPFPPKVIELWKQSLGGVN